jgi:predicted porin
LKLNFTRIALAGAALMLAGAAASAQTSADLRIYGVLDAFVESANTGRETLNRLGSGGIFTSRWGLIGTEDLGGGMKAFFKLESGFNIDTGTLGGGGRAWSRESTVGLERPDWGRVEFGRMPTQINESVSSFWMGRYGAGNFTYNPAQTMTHDNGLKYTTPSYAGVNVSAHYDFGETAGSPSSNQAWSLQGQYRQGPVNALLGYFTSTGPRDIAAGDGVKIITAAASYNFGNLQPAVLFQSNRSKLAPLTLNRDTLNLGLDIFLDIHLLRLEAEFTRDKALANADARALSIRYDHRLSKRTQLYVGAVKIINGAKAYYQIIGAGGQLPVTPPTSAAYNGTDPRSLIVGVAHSF